MYDASKVEDGIYAAWEKSGAFNPDTLPERNQTGEPYCIVMPPPNRTGTLHMGHAAMLAIEDLLIRFHRMRGKRTLWIPGTDHAAIATQVKVEQELMKLGMNDPRRELGREKFLEKVVEFADASAKRIRSQIRKLGSSCDWSRERYTLDDDRSRAVFEVFRLMYEDGIIERGNRIVNWDPQFQTTLSDDEVETKAVTAKFLTFKYDKDFPIAISTTRPETKFGDTAVAVHPEDQRYKKFVGKIFTPTFCGKKLTIKIIADEAVDPNFGTGALGVTPAHALIDAEMAERHGLPTIQVIGPDAKLLDEAGKDFAGLTIVAARKKIENLLKDAKLLEKIEEVLQNLPIAQRGGAPVEQLPMRQWFVRVNKKFKQRQVSAKGGYASGGKSQKSKSLKVAEDTTLKELMREAVASKQINIIPERFEKNYFHWIDNLRDWCISRQIWFGHRIPVWYHEPKCVPKPGREREMDQCKKIFISVEKPTCAFCDAEYIQDPDTLDTWFSAGLWTFSALGWPNKKTWEEHRDYHPTAVLETGYDILFFWVARMILMTTYALGDIPFKDVYLHGLVRDEEGRKMSKSLGNVIDPLDMIAKYGTDAVRLSLVLGTTPGQDVRLSEAKVEGLRNFTNKLWNIGRFILITSPPAPLLRKERGEKNAHLTKGDYRGSLADAWILSRLSAVTASVTQKIERYEFSSAGEELRDFTWNDFADWYLEIAKVEKGKETIFSHALVVILKLWHPFMPFVTEEIWKQAGFNGQLIVAEWPPPQPLLRKEGVSTQSPPSEGDFGELSRTGVEGVKDFELLRSLITDIRRLRAEQKIEPAKRIEVTFVADKKTRRLIEENGDIVKHLARASEMLHCATIPSGWATTVSGKTTIGINVVGVLDAATQRVKLEKEIAEFDAYVASRKKKLANKEFLAKAPKHVIEQMKKNLEEAERKRKVLS